MVHRVPVDVQVAAQFDVLLRPAVESPMVSSIQLILDASQRELWQQAIQPRIAACVHNEKVREPHWRSLSKTVSFILSDNQMGAGTKALTNVAKTHVPDDVYEVARKYLTEKELADLSLAVVAINAWSRLAVAFRKVPGTYRPSRP